MLYGQILIKEANQQYTAPEEGSWGRAARHGLGLGLGGALLGGGLSALPGLITGDMETAKGVGLTGAAIGGAVGGGMGAWSGANKETPDDYFLRLAYDPTKNQELSSLIAQHMYLKAKPKADMSKTNLNHPHFNYVKPTLDEAIKYH